MQYLYTFYRSRNLTVSAYHVELAATLDDLRGSRSYPLLVHVSAHLHRSRGFVSDLTLAQLSNAFFERNTYSITVLVVMHSENGAMEIERA